MDYISPATGFLATRVIDDRVAWLNDRWILIAINLNQTYMSISKEIHQREFRNEYQKAIINIMYTHNYMVNHMTDVFKDFDITVGHVQGHS